MLRTICAFCGSSPGRDPAYGDAAALLGRTLASAGRRLVYGGGRVGLMGVLADAVLRHGGEVVGVIPQHLVDLEVGHTGLSQLRVVQSMHERKALMSSMADGFVLLPGGLGSLEEFFEVLTWGQLGLHRKPYGILNVAGYYDRLLTFLDHAVRERFIRQEHRALIIEATEPRMLLDHLDALEVPSLPKWMDAEHT